MAEAKVIFSKTNLCKLVFEYAGGNLQVWRNSDTTISMKFPIDDFRFVKADSIYEEFFPGISIEKVIFGKRTKNENE